MVRLTLDPHSPPFSFLQQHYTDSALLKPLFLRPSGDGQDAGQYLFDRTKSLSNLDGADAVLLSHTGNTPPGLDHYKLSCCRLDCPAHFVWIVDITILL